MNCLFVHDFRSYKKNDEFYTTNLSYEIFRKRYLKIFRKINILNRCGRMDVKENENNYVKASGKNVEFIDEIEIFNAVTFLKKYSEIKNTVNRNIEKNDFIIIRLDSFLGLIAAKYCRKNRKKYLIEVVGCVFDSFWNKGMLGKIIAIPLYFITKYEIKNAPYVVYVTSNFLQTRYPTFGKKTNISNVELIDKHDKTLMRRFEKIEKIENIDEHIFDIVTIAAVNVKYKGQDTVIKTISYLKKKGYKNYRFNIIGGGNNSYLKKLAKKLNVEEQVIFYGSVRHEEVMEMLKNFDIYIQPSKQEGLPRALIEGMSCGLLCFRYKCCWNPRIT